MIGLIFYVLLFFLACWFIICIHIFVCLFVVCLFVSGVLSNASKRAETDYYNYIHIKNIQKEKKERKKKEKKKEKVFFVDFSRIFRTDVWTSKTYERQWFCSILYSILCIWPHFKYHNVCNNHIQDKGVSIEPRKT